MLIYRPLITYPLSPYTMRHDPDSSELSLPMLSPPLLSVLMLLILVRIVEVRLRDGLNNFHVPYIINVAYTCAGLLSYRIWNLKVQEKAVNLHMMSSHLFLKELRII